MLRRAADPRELHQGILKAIRDIELSTLSLGLELARIKALKLYQDLGYRRMRGYVLALAAEAGKDKSCIYNWLCIGETYLDFQDDLEKIGFNGMVSSSKLPYLRRALKKRPQKEVYDYLLRLSHRQFVKYTRFGPESLDTSMDDVPFSDVGKETVPPHEVDYIFFRKRKPAVIIKGGLGERTFKMLWRAVKIAFKALAKNTSLVAVHQSTTQEHDRFLAAAPGFRAQIKAEIRAERAKERQAKKEGQIHV